MANHGGKRQGAGRKSKSEEQKITEKLSPFEDEAITALHKNIKKGEHWAVKLYFEYMYGKPTQQIDTTLNTDGERIEIHVHVDDKTD